MPHLKKMSASKHDSRSQYHRLLLHRISGHGARPAEKLRCDDYLTLVAASSIIRPAAESGMMRSTSPDITNRSAVRYLHPLFKEHLSETFGVMVYREDVIKIAHYFAQLDLARNRYPEARHERQIQKPERV